MVGFVVVRLFEFEIDLGCSGVFFLGLVSGVSVIDGVEEAN